MIRHLALVTTLLLIAYAPFLSGGFLTDDFVHLERLTRVPSVAAAFTSADAFGFYRPLTQASLTLDLLLFGPDPFASRAVNLALHAAVLAAAFLLARLILGQRAAVLATLAFALTPKAHPIAVLWISARAELLMSLGSFVAVAAWIVWSRNGRAAWLALAAAAYASAVLGKETAVLLPALFLLAPGATRSWRSRLVAVGIVATLGAFMIAARGQAGALMPLSSDAHYGLGTPLSLWVHNLRNYTARMLPAPLLLLLLVGGAAQISARSIGVRGNLRAHVPIVAFSLAWPVILLAPVLPIPDRSELYLYLPVFGLCMLTGLAVELLLPDRKPPRLVLAATAACVVLLGGYQVSRMADLHRDLEFSEKFVRAVERYPAFDSWNGPVAIVPSDAAAGRALRNAIGLYLPFVLRHIFDDERRTGVVEYDGIRPDPQALRVVCEYNNDREVRLLPYAASGQQ